MANSHKYFLLTIDVEDWFQVENFKPWIPFDSWSSRQLRVEKNTHRLLDLLDSIELRGQKAEDRRQRSESRGQKAEDRRQRSELRGQKTEGRGQKTDFRRQKKVEKSQKSSKSCLKEITGSGIKSTFFVLGWIAERLPHLVREIHARGHEVASHGYNHDLCTKIQADDLKKDLTTSKKLLEDLIGAPVTGYRAPSFSITGSVLKIIQECGYQYDSSYNSFNLNPRYGTISLNGQKKSGITWQLDNNFHELPISNLELNHPFNFELSAMSSGQNNKKHFVLPWGGGGYFRLIPFPIFKKGIKAIFKNQNAYLFYMHPWEIDPEQPRVQEASRRYMFRHYINLDKTYSKLIRLIDSFKQYRFITCKQYLDTNIKIF